MHIVLNNHQHIHGLNKEQRDLVKDALTFPNPAYKSAKRYGKSRYISIPQNLYFYNEYSELNEDGVREKVLEVPIGFNINSVNLQTEEKWLDERQGGETTLTQFPEFQLELRDAQREAVEPFLNHLNGNGLIQLPTGKGKSILACYLASRLGVKTLILVHKDDLVTGWKKDIELCFGGKVKAGLIKAKSRKVGEQITIATVQTLGRMSKEELAEYTNQFGFVVQDECHHVGLKIFNIIDSFNSQYKLGLTATPVRSDGLDFTFDLFLGGLAYKYEIKEDDADVLPVEVITVESKAMYRPFIYEGETFNYYDYKENELPSNLVFIDEIPYKERPRVTHLEIDDNLVRNNKHKIRVCKDIKSEYLLGRSCIAFFIQKEHIRIYQRYLKLLGIPSDQILLYYGDSKESAQEMMQKAENKECLITLATYAKATEGTNVKAWEVGFLVSSCNNEKNTEQAVGRIRRSKEGKINPVKLYDYRFPNAYSVRNHGKTRDNVYKRLKFKYTPERTGRLPFSRGY